MGFSRLNPSAMTPVIDGTGRDATETATWYRGKRTPTTSLPFASDLSPSRALSPSNSPSLRSHAISLSELSSSLSQSPSLSLSLSIFSYPPLNPSLSNPYQVVFERLTTTARRHAASFASRVIGALPVIGLLARIISDEVRVGDDLINFAEFRRPVGKNCSIIDFRTLYEFQDHRGRCLDVDQFLGNIYERSNRVGVRIKSEPLFYEPSTMNALSNEKQLHAVLKRAYEKGGGKLQASHLRGVLKLLHKHTTSNFANFASSHVKRAYPFTITVAYATPNMVLIFSEGRPANPLVDDRQSDNPIRPKA
ncbi:hypothetical protein ACLOJK_035983 [Asimina triloba]